MKHASKNINLSLILSKKQKIVSKIKLVVFLIILLGLDYNIKLSNCLFSVKDGQIKDI